MAASTIPNSGGPGSSVELSPVTIAVRDKVIEKFGDQPLDQMNESVKQLLATEEDEQKRLGILAARVYILRQRISRIAEGDPDRVVASAAPKASDLMPPASDATDTEAAPSEWTRLRILDDCEVNGVRFPKTVIIDVKSADADRLIASGNAELVEPDPASDIADATEATAAPAEGGAGDADDAPAAAETAATAEAGEAPETSADQGESDDDDLSALAATLDDAPAPQMNTEEPPEPSDQDHEPEQEVDQVAEETTEQGAGGEAVIEAPSAAEVTAALEALGGGDSGMANNDMAGNGGGDADDSQEADPVPAETAVAADTSDSAGEAAVVAAELEALSAALAPQGEAESATSDTDTASSDAADVAAELEAAAAAMAAVPANPDTTDLSSADYEDDGDGDGDGDADSDAEKPAGWFEAQQNAEASKRNGDKSEDDDA